MVAGRARRRGRPRLAIGVGLSHLLRQHLSAVEVRRHGVGAEAAPGGGFGLVQARLVLKQLPSPNAALTTMVGASVGLATDHAPRRLVTVNGVPGSGSECGRSCRLPGERRAVVRLTALGGGVVPAWGEVTSRSSWSVVGVGCAPRRRSIWRQLSRVRRAASLPPSAACVVASSRKADSDHWSVCSARWASVRACSPSPPASNSSPARTAAVVKASRKRSRSSSAHSAGPHRPDTLPDTTRRPAGRRRAPE